MNKDWERLKRDLQKIASKQGFYKYFEVPVWAYAEEVRANLKEYPERPSHPVPFESDKQRKYIWAMINKYGFYVRTYYPTSQNLGKSWAIAKEGLGQLVLGTRVTYAPYVQSAERQIAMHRKTGWITDEKAVELARKKGVFEKALMQVFASVFKGGV